MTFADTADAVAASTEMIDSKMGKSLKKFLTKNIIKKELKDKVKIPEKSLKGTHPSGAKRVETGYFPRLRSSSFCTVMFDDWRGAMAVVCDG